MVNKRGIGFMFFIYAVPIILILGALIWAGYLWAQPITEFIKTFNTWKYWIFGGVLVFIFRKQIWQILQAFFAKLGVKL